MECGDVCESVNRLPVIYFAQHNVPRQNEGGEGGVVFTLKILSTQ